MSKDNLLPCPFCGGEAKRGIGMEEGLVACSNRKCGTAEAWYTPEQWNALTPTNIEKVVEAARVLRDNSHRVVNYLRVNVDDWVALDAALDSRDERSG